MLRHAAALFLFILSLALAGPASAEPKCDKGTAKKPHLESAIMTLPGGGLPHRRAYVLLSCWDNAGEVEGLADANGKLLVPAIYNRIVPISPTTVLVQPAIAVKQFYQEREPWRLYVIGKGEQGPAPWKHIWAPQWNAEQYAIGWNQAYECCSTEFFLLAGGPDNVVPIRNLGGAARGPGEVTLESYHGTLIAHFTAADGTPVSRILDMYGKPVSPVLGAIERWDTYAPLWPHEFRHPSYKDKNRILATDYLSVIMTGEHDVLPYGKLYVPIDEAGQPLPLPAGVIGVLPLKFLPPPNSDNVTLGWALVEDGPGGLRARAAFGTLQSVIARASTLPVYTGLARSSQGMTDRNAFIRDVFLVRKPEDGLWHLLDANLFAPTPAPGDGPQVSGRTTSETYAAYVESRMAFQRGIIAQHERERAEAEARFTATLEARHQEMVAAGSYCEWQVGGPLLAPKTIELILANCAVQSDAMFNYARSRGANPQIVADAEYKYWKARGRFATPIPPAPPGTFTSPNWEAWGNSIIKSAKESTDTFVRERRRDYYQNLERWNRGYQKSCC
ncbi:hypothetical protein [Sphingopyxis sp. KK2]|uniref:hypothetical protein n=1 Tax=Sphingopyxis sp. KK2 TaxID=1855727 RepID=UPI0011819E2B|nr:hypothetical protein [Sphingopyxis sp. KK2]